MDWTTGLIFYLKKSGKIVKEKYSIILCVWGGGRVRKTKNSVPGGVHMHT